MPADIKKAAIALVISLISTLIAVYFDSVEYQELAFSDPLIIGTNFIWALMVAWIIWDLFRGKSIRLTLILVGIIMIAALIWDFLFYGYKPAQIFYAIEILMFAVSYSFVSSGQSKTWFACKQSDAKVKLNG